MPRLPKISGLTLAKWFVRLYAHPLESLEKIVAKVGKVVAFDGGKYQKLQFVSEPDFIKHILKTNKSNFKRSPVIKALRPLLGKGIFISEDQEWQSQRSQLKPGFHEQVIQSFEAVITDECAKLCKSWLGRKGLINIEKEIELLMLRILFKTQFCSDIDVDYKEIHRAHYEVLQETSIRNQKIRFYVNKLRKSVGLRPKSTMHSTAISYLDTVAFHVIAYGRNNRKNCSYWLNDLFDQNMDETAIRDQILNFIFAGYDTTASAITWTLYQLATHTSDQEKCRAEANEVSSTFANLSALNYSKRCIQESMRLFPPVWSIHRQSSKPDTIQGHHFDSGTYFMICAYTLHRDPDYWERPSEFIPNRFDGDGMRGKAFHYIPFGQGERVCIGQSLALMESQLVISSILRNFHINYLEKKAPRITPGIIMKTRDGLYLDVIAVS